MSEEPREGAAVRRALVPFAAVCLAACGGGGGGSGGPQPDPFETREYFANRGLETIHAASAYAAGGTGRGVTVAVIDTGIDIDHPEFAGAIAPASTDIVRGGAAFVDDVDGHGTAVAGIIGARRNGALSHGVAFESAVLAVRADEVGSCPSCSFRQDDLAAATNYVAAQGAGVINYSVGGASVLDAGLASALGQAVDAGAILIMAAGNGGAAEPTFPARFAASAEAAGQAIAVGAVDAENAIAPFSNRAGSTQEHFLVAPGVQVLAPVPGGGAALVSGTSFAAPHVSGAAAILLQAAPFLSPQQVVDLLLGTARDLGVPGPDPVYGRGMVDLQTALRPQGELGVPLGASVDATSAPMAATELALGPAFGPGPGLGSAIFLDGYGRPYRLDLDALVGRRARTPDLAHWLDPELAGTMIGGSLGSVAGFALRAPPGEARRPGRTTLGEGEEADPAFRLSAALGQSHEIVLSHGWGLGNEFGVGAALPGLTGGLMGGAALAPAHLDLVAGGDMLSLRQALGGGWSLKMGLANGDAGSGRGTGRGALAEIAHRSPDAALALQLGYAQEKQDLLGSSGEGAFALPAGASTAFIGASAVVPLARRLRAFGQLSHGTTQARDPGAGLIRGVSTVQSVGFALGVALDRVWIEGDGLTLALSQPLRVVEGSAVLDRPVGRTFEGRILRREDHIDLAPEGREIDLEVAYRLRLTEAATFSLVWLTRLEPGHDAGRPPDHAIAMKIGRRF